MAPLPVSVQTVRLLIEPGGAAAARLDCGGRFRLRPCMVTVGVCTRACGRRRSTVSVTQNLLGLASAR